MNAICKVCGRQLQITNRKNISYFCKQCYIERVMRVRPPEFHPSWRGGKTIKKGYVAIRIVGHPFATKTGYVSEHRLVMEKHIGRYLKRTEVVHHINGIKSDNRIENLVLFENNSAHIINSRRRFCKICGAPRSGRGYCGKHYQQIYKDRIKPKTKCIDCGVAKFLDYKAVDPHRTRCRPCSDKHRREH